MENIVIICMSIMLLATKTTSVRADDYVDLSLTADNDILELYFDGQLVSIASSIWTEVRTVAMPTDTRVIAVKCLDQGVVAGFLASTSDERVLTNSNWKCMSGKADANWASPDYDDSNWPAAVVARQHSAVDIHGVLKGISSNANWIWTANNGYGLTNIDAIVYCRFTLSD